MAVEISRPHTKEARRLLALRKRLTRAAEKGDMQAADEIYDIEDRLIELYPAVLKERTQVFNFDEKRLVKDLGLVQASHGTPILGRLLAAIEFAEVSAQPEQGNDD